MKSQLATAFALAGVVAAQSECLSLTTGYPACTASCLESAAAAGGCTDSSDFSCQCNPTPEIKVSVARCIINNCNQDLAVIQAVHSVHEAVCHCANSLAAPPVVPATPDLKVRGEESSDWSGSGDDEDDCEPESTTSKGYEHTTSSHTHSSETNKWTTTSHSSYKHGTTTKSTEKATWTTHSSYEHPTSTHHSSSYKHPTSTHHSLSHSSKSHPHSTESYHHSTESHHHLSTTKKAHPTTLTKSYTRPSKSHHSKSGKGYTTSTVYTTRIHTVTSCAPEVTNCPAKGHVTTETVALYTTVCPVTETETSKPTGPAGGKGSGPKYSSGSETYKPTGPAGGKGSGSGYGSGSETYKQAAPTGSSGSGSGSGYGSGYGSGSETYKQTAPTGGSGSGSGSGSGYGSSPASASGYGHGSASTSAHAPVVTAGAPKEFNLVAGILGGALIVAIAL